MTRSTVRRRASFAAAREFETFSHDSDTVETVIARVER
jgi:hypothetical protein